MERFSLAERVQIIIKFSANRRCISDTLNALKSRGITTATEADILNYMACFILTGGVRDNDVQVYKKHKGIQDSEDAAKLIETEQLTNHIKKHKILQDDTDALYPFETLGPSDSKIPKISGSFIEEGGYVVVYTDGACENNGKRNAKAGIGVWFGDNHPLNVSRPVVGRATNNTGEIQACVVALQILHREGIQKVRLKTDSQFTINCITKWIKKWKHNNWKLAAGGNVKNKEDLILLDDIQNKIEEVDWVHIRGHSGEKGNEEADKLARNGASLYNSTGEVHDCNLKVYEKCKGIEDRIDASNTFEMERARNVRKKQRTCQDRTDAPYQFEAQQPSDSKIPKISNSFIEEGEYVVVYTDGACENNGKYNARAGIGVWFGDNHPLNVSRPVMGRPTNNTGEIQACVVALQILHREGIQKVRLKTDSQFTINCITKWIKKWKRNNWKLTDGGDVKNKEDLIMLDDIRNKILEVDWVHIRGHSGEKGNEEADKLARTGALLYKKM